MERAFADRISTLGPPASHRVIAMVRDLRAQGVDIIDFGQQGATPDTAKQAAASVMQSSEGSAYTDTRGRPGLRHVIADKLARENGISADPDSEIVVTLGAKEAILASLLALVGPGDEVLIEDPAYVGFEPLIRLVGGVPVRIPLHAQHGFRFPVEKLQGFLTPRTRLLLLCNPHNPGGHCHSAQDLAAIAEVAKRADIHVLVDEAYEHFVYDGAKHVSLASLDGMFERTITVQTVSKIYNMAGWRVGWAAAAAPLMAKIAMVHAHAVTCPTSFAQAGAEAAIRDRIGEGNDPIAEIVRRYATQRDAMVDGLRAIPGVTCTKPRGAFFVFPDLSAFGMSSIDMCGYLLEQARISAVPGSAFGPHGEGHLRLVFKSNVGVIRQGITRLADALAKLDHVPADASGRA
jgi:aspartate/methionine/tyrosine aminotransferase